MPNLWSQAGFHAYCEARRRDNGLDGVMPESVFVGRALRREPVLGAEGLGRRARPSLQHSMKFKAWVMRKLWLRHADSRFERLRRLRSPRFWERQEARRELEAEQAKPRKPGRLKRLDL